MPLFYFSHAFALGFLFVLFLIPYFPSISLCWCALQWLCSDGLEGRTFPGGGLGGKCVATNAVVGTMSFVGLGRKWPLKWGRWSLTPSGFGGWVAALWWVGIVTASSESVICCSVFPMAMLPFWLHTSNPGRGGGGFSEGQVGRSKVPQHISLC